ncbi:MAG: glycoside hydrolase family 3 N-terminal domain-containing protein [Thermodesulfovibrionales bacterium]
MNPYNFLIPRLNGDEIEDRFDYYAGLVRKGVAGFIIFGGEIESLRDGIRRLQEIAKHQLIIASDLEAGLGQQVRGGTLYPPAMAIAKALSRIGGERNYYLKRLYSSIASEAQYVGINTILAPVLDINSNPENPIIATRSFGEDPETVSFHGTSMIKIYKEMGIISCGKHFPGHGDTDRDSHQELPVINKGLGELEEFELVPFKRAILSSVDMIMLGHLSVPCLDPSGIPATISSRIVKYLRDEMAFKGLVITDAMNMGGLSGYPEEEASLMALMAGTDLILHPSDPDSVAGYIGDRVKAEDRLKALSFRLTSALSPQPSAFSQPDFTSNRELASELFYKAITYKGNKRGIKKPFLIVISDETITTSYFTDWFKGAFGENRVLFLNETVIPWQRIPERSERVVSIFSEARAWKEKSLNFKDLLNKFNKKVEVFLSFGNPYILSKIKSPTIFAYSTSEEAQIAMVRYIKEKGLFNETT